MRVSTFSDSPISVESISEGMQVHADRRVSESLHDQSVCWKVPSFGITSRSYNTTQLVTPNEVCKMSRANRDHVGY